MELVRPYCTLPSVRTTERRRPSTHTNELANASETVERAITQL